MCLAYTTSYLANFHPLNQFVRFPSLQFRHSIAQYRLLLHQNLVYWWIFVFFASNTNFIKQLNFIKYVLLETK